MNRYYCLDAVTEAAKPNLVRALFHQRVVLPVMHLLRCGASPGKLAWSLAVGISVGINPLLGTTTLACLAIAFLLRLNLVASQITNHLVYPLQLTLFFVFLRIGSFFFHTGALPLSRNALLSGAVHHPWATTRAIWPWEWHALIVWFLCTLLITPIFAAALRPVLTRLLKSLQTRVTSA